MRNSSPEMDILIVFIVAAITLPFVIGMVIMKIYRKFKPFEEINSDSMSISISLSHQRDGFFKMLFLGWLVCSPIFYFLYQIY